MRHFEFQEGTSHKFWEVSVEGDTLVVRFGKVGTQGQTQTKPFESEDVAQQACEKLVLEKLRKGYVEGAAPEPRPGPAPAKEGPPPQSPAPHATSPATRVLLRSSSGEELDFMLAEKRVALREGGHWQVQALASAEAAKDHFERLVFLRGKQGYLPVETTQVPAEQAEAELERSLASFDGTVELREGRGIITFEGSPEHPVPPSACASLLKWLAREAPRSVQLVCDFASPKKAWARALKGVTLQSLESFILDTSFQSQTRQYANSVGDLAAVLAACPRLEHLFANGDLALGPARHESLRELYLLGNPLSPALLEGLGRCEFPRLERLALSLASEAQPPPAPLALKALRALRAPVREVHLDTVEPIEDVLELLASGGLPPSWKVLTLGGDWGYDDEHERVHALLQRHASVLGTLEVLGLPAHVMVESAVVRTRPSEEYSDRFSPGAYAAW